MKHYYPFNYFFTIFSPERCFTNRRYLNVFQIILTLLFLMALMLTPISLQQGQLQQADLADYVPVAIGLVDEPVVEKINQLDESNGQLAIGEAEVLLDSEDQIVAFTTQTEDLAELIGDRTGLVFTPEAFILKESDRPGITQPYVADSALTQVGSVDELRQEMSRQWYISNQSSVRLSNIIYISILVLTSFLILMLGASFFLSLMKRNEAFDINSFREAFTLVLNTYGVPTIVATIVGVLTRNVMTMLSTHGVVFILYLIFVYWRTHFNDEYVASKQVKKHNQHKLLRK